MNEIKEGDRVRNTTKNAYIGLNVGHRGTVTSTDGLIYEVRWDGDPIDTSRPDDLSWPMYESEIEVI